MRKAPYYIISLKTINNTTIVGREEGCLKEILGGFFL